MAKCRALNILFLVLLGIGICSAARTLHGDGDGDATGYTAGLSATAVYGAGSDGHRADDPAYRGRGGGGSDRGGGYSALGDDSCASRSRSGGGGLHGPGYPAGSPGREYWEHSDDDAFHGKIGRGTGGGDAGGPAGGGGAGSGGDAGGAHGGGYGCGGSGGEGGGGGYAGGAGVGEGGGLGGYAP